MMTQASDATAFQKSPVCKHLFPFSRRPIVTRATSYYRISFEGQHFLDLKSSCSSKIPFVVPM